MNYPFLSYSNTATFINDTTLHYQITPLGTPYLGTSFILTTPFSFTHTTHHKNIFSLHNIKENEAP